MVDAPSGSAPVIDNRVSPRGVLPRRTQTWLMMGLALGVLAIIVFAGHPAPAVRPVSPGVATTALAPSPERLPDYQDRLRLLDERARQQATSLNDARTRNGFTPVVREQLFKKFRGLEIKDCPFVNLPEAKSGRWGAGLTAAKMKDCRWLNPVLVAQIEFLEWTGENHLRHTKFIALRDDKPAREVMREQRSPPMPRFAL
ncbi:MAG TPA: hypothetical protein VK504_22155 [Vicinamibacterales bacterium]|nr:hypothetical protein [Vicinamibacterales bacterium]